MNIAFFTDSYFPYTSGVVRSIETFKTNLEALGHNVYIFAPRYPHAKKQKNIYRFASIPAITNRDFYLALPFSFTIKKQITKLKIDIIHVHSPFLLGRLGANIAKTLNIPLVFTYHTLYDQYVHYAPFAQKISGQIINRFCRNFCNHCNLVITPTNVVKDILKKLGVQTQIESIPTGININKFMKVKDNTFREKYGIPFDAKVLLFVGRIGKEKNITFLLDAFKALTINESCKPLLVLVGGGPELEYYKSRSKELNIDQHTIFTGNLNYDEVINAYLASDLFVFASKTETQGLVLGEAKAAGLAIVAVEAFGASEMVENNIDGYLVQEKIDEFNHKITHLLNHASVLIEFKKNATHNAEKISDISCSKRLIEAYAKLLATKN
jgi:1,2-diacylglycerol 3-alpha-glucosyltransferase